MSDSKGQQQQQQDLVDDSWEEIDEDRLAARLSLSKLSNDDGTTQPTGGGGGESSEGGSSRSGGSRGLLPVSTSLSAALEEELRPRMILQRPQQMQILRRPQSLQAQQDGSEKAAAESKPKAQIKSLDQRKQAYAEARLRILGSAHDEEEQQQTKQIEQAPKKGSPNTNGYRINSNNSNIISSSTSSSSNSTNNNGGNVRLDRPHMSFRPSPLSYHHMPQLPPGHSFYGPVSSSGRIPLEPSNHHFYPGQQQQQQQQQQVVGPHVPGGYHFQHHQQPPHHLHQKPMPGPPYGMPLAQSSSTGFHQHHGMGSISVYGGGGGGGNGGIGAFGHHHNSNNNVLRTPAGPDGSHGFAMRR
nr:GATA zinc finger domain-containing protein 10 [Aedes albopictus]